MSAIVPPDSQPDRWVGGAAATPKATVASNRNPDSKPAPRIPEPLSHRALAGHVTVLTPQCGAEPNRRSGGSGREVAAVVWGLRWWVGAARVVHVFEAVLADLERAVDAVVVGCDPELITASSAMELVGRIDRLERRLAG